MKIENNHRCWKVKLEKKMRFVKQFIANTTLMIADIISILVLAINHLCLSRVFFLGVSILVPFQEFPS